MKDAIRTPLTERTARVRAQLPYPLARAERPPPTARGKVRDLYARGDELWLVATDRVSAFDVVLGTVPFKGEALTEQAAFWLEQASDIIETHFLERPDPQVMRCRRAEPLPLELVVRGYLAGSLMREPKETRGKAYGLTLDPALGDYEPFDAPIVTPTTKAAAGEHDQPCSLDDLVRAGVVTRSQLERAIEAALALFARGARFAEAQGLLLVDTKYELGLVGDRLVLIDEVHTADSSRFWRKDSYEDRLAAGLPPDMLDKERLRRWLAARGFTGHGEPPSLTDEIREELAVHYWELTELVLGRPFAPAGGAVQTRVEATLARALPFG